MIVHRTEVLGVAVISLTAGELAEDPLQVVNEVLEGHRSLVIDLSPLKRLDVRCCVGLWQVKKQAASIGKTVYLSSPRPVVRQLLFHAGMHLVFPILNDAEEVDRLSPEHPNGEVTGHFHQRRCEV
jgi:anti-anti-sigma regulatory factor